MPLQRTETPVLAALPGSLPKIFEQVQISTANHQKNFVALNKLHSAAAEVTAPLQNGIDVQLTGERAFEDLFIEMIVRVLPMKKGTTVVDRVVKFIAGYVKFINEKEKQVTDKDDDDDTPTSRFVSRLIRYLLRGFEAKDKIVRFRVLQVVAEVVTNMGDIEENMYKLLHPALIGRAHDKEPSVRTQAIIALVKLLSPDNSDDDQEEIMDVLLDTLALDPASEVRKATLQRLPLTAATIPSIIKRTRDVDATIRKMVYAPVLEALESPKQLTIAQRELLVLAGLKDREPAVCAAAAKLVASWADVDADIIRFVELFDFELFASAGEDNPAQLALMSLFKSRKDILDGVEFGEVYWAELTPAKAFLARVFVDYCIGTNDDTRIEANMPVMTALAFKIQALYNEYVSREQADEENRAFGGEVEEDGARRAAETADKMFVIGELMKLSLNLDYADEIGRRKMFTLVRYMISQESLPDNLVPLSLDILRKLSSDEHDLIRIVVEVIHDLRDTDIDEDNNFRAQSADSSMSMDETPMPARTPGRPRKPLPEMTAEERERADSIDLRCLALCIGMLERVNSSFERNSTLEGVLGELILPAVKRKELALREKGFICLGLCCLIARGMALNSFQLFLQQIQPSPESLKIRILQIVFDILMVYEGDFLRNTNIGGDRVVEFLTRVFETTSSHEVQAVLCKGLSKLLISGMITDEKVLQSLVLAYMSPETVDNQEVRQCLSYVLPAYCYSSSQNQRRMQKIVLSTYEELSRMHEELEEDEEMVSPLQAGTLLVDWTDPQKSMEVDGRQTDELIHFDLAIDIVKGLFNKDLDKDDKKVLCQLLGKLYLPDDVDDDKIRTLKLLVNNVRSRRPPKDSTSNSALSRFEKALSSKYDAQLKGFDEDEYRQLEELKELFEFLDDIIPDDDDEEEAPKRASRKRRSESIISVTTEGADEDDYRGAPEPKPASKSRSKAKKRRVSNSDEGSGAETSSAPTRTLPKRAARRAPVVIEAIPDTEEDEVYEVEPLPSPSPSPSLAPSEVNSDELTPPPPTPRPKPKGIARDGSFMRRRAEQARRDDDATVGDHSIDSIIDATVEADEDEGDDDEVDNLLDDL